MNVDAASLVRHTSDQVFFLFTGNAHQLNINPIEFIQKTRLADRNIVIFRDPARSGYRQGAADSHEALEAIVAWQRAQLAGPLAHVREVFCVGTSSGGLPAIYTACRLAARAAWSLGGRILKSGVLEEREQLAAQFDPKTLAQARAAGMTPQQRAQVRQAASHPGVRRFQMKLRASPDVVVDNHEVTRMVDVLGASTVPTHFHFYFATTNAIDRHIAEAFDGCPGASMHPIDPRSRGASTAAFSLTDSDHEVVPMLEQAGTLDTLFAAYL